MAYRRRKKYQIIRSTTRENFEAVEVGGRRLKFGKHGAFNVADAGLAREIRQRYGQDRRGTGEVAVAEIEERPVAGQPTVFRNPGVPWARYDALGRRIPDES